MSSEVTYKFKVEMTCEGCSGAATRVLNKIKDKLSSFDVDLENKTVTVTTSNMSSDELTEILKKTGKDVTYEGTV